MTNGWHLASKAINEPGLRVRCRTWPHSMHIHFTGSLWLDEGNRVFHPSFSSGEWELYAEAAKEPKTVTMWQPVVKRKGIVTKHIYYAAFEDKIEFDAGLGEQVLGWIRHTIELEQGDEC